MCTSCPGGKAFKHAGATSFPASRRETPPSPCRKKPSPRTASGSSRCQWRPPRQAQRHGLATGPALLLAPALAALTAAALLAAALASALAVAALATPLDRVDVGCLVLILLALHHGNCSAVLMPMQG
jgi:hypothetical protein